MKFKLLKDAPFIGKKDDVVEIERKDYQAILKHGNFIDKEYVETKTKAKKTVKKDTDSDEQ